jgi:hypothetical protein
MRARLDGIEGRDPVKKSGVHAFRRALAPPSEYLSGVGAVQAIAGGRCMHRSREESPSSTGRDAS